MERAVSLFSPPKPCHSRAIVGAHSEFVREAGSLLATLLAAELLCLSFEELIVPVYELFVRMLRAR